LPTEYFKKANNSYCMNRSGKSQPGLIT